TGASDRSARSSRVPVRRGGGSCRVLSGGRRVRGWRGRGQGDPLVHAGGGASTDHLGRHPGSRQTSRVSVRIATWPTGRVQALTLSMVDGNSRSEKPDAKANTA